MANWLLDTRRNHPTSAGVYRVSDVIDKGGNPEKPQGPKHFCETRQKVLHYQRQGRQQLRECRLLIHEDILIADELQNAKDP